MVHQPRCYRLLRLLRCLLLFDAFRLIWGLRLEGLVKFTRGSKNPSAQRLLAESEASISHFERRNGLNMISAADATTLICSADHHFTMPELPGRPVHTGMAG